MGSSGPSKRRANFSTPSSWVRVFVLSGLFVGFPTEEALKQAFPSAQSSRAWNIPQWLAQKVCVNDINLQQKQNSSVLAGARPRLTRLG